MKNSNNNNVNSFIYAVDDMLKSKYIMVDRKISDILVSIANTKDVYDTIAVCMINYDFKIAWKNSLGQNLIKLPENDDDKIAFIYCLLNNIDEKNIDITQLLDKYYSYDVEVKPYEQFCNSVVLVFKTLILKKLGLIVVKEKTVEQKKEKDEAYKVLSMMLHDFAQELLVQKKLKHVMLEKNKLIAIISTFEQAASEKNSGYFYSFMIMIESAIAKNKDLIGKFKPIQEVVYKLIED